MRTNEFGQIKSYFVICFDGVLVNTIVLILCILQYKYIKNIYSVRSYIIFCDLSIPFHTNYS